jgi:hypothetical protein
LAPTDSPAVVVLGGIKVDLVTITSGRVDQVIAEL